MANHLRTYRVDVHELLTTSCVTLLRHATNWLVVAHCRQALIRDPSQVAPLVKADFVVARRLYHLRLVHDLSDLFL